MNPVDWRLRRAGAGDEAALALVAAATFLETYAGIVSRDDMLAHCATKCSAGYFGAWIASADHLLTLSEHPDGAAPLGFTALTPPDFPVAFGPETIELRRIYVLTTAHGSGLGAALMERAVEDARGLGKARLALGVHPGNVRARAFYERHGFRIVGERRFQVGAAVFADPVYARAI
ncbi:GNAT family N-acetyltransferase [uncultured Sphingomonas sp.]|uniref:GNAT family N-acetyltransferase n=1 Tax=uncultured Sphingomonas sp. TaxID=158754 RepID=UPI0035CA60F5